MNKKYELLAPAKDIGIGIAAINCGADAIYIGAEKFSAREEAKNSLDDISKLVSYAHQYYAKVYVTINTILNNSEIQQAIDLINRLYKIGVDAIIIQDVGILEFTLPPIQIFASTQMNIDSVEKALFFEQIGIKRIVLPREFNLNEIKEINDKTNIELECFVHGALCVSFSGQCYLSYALGKRSGNRGNCAQPCRRKYSLLDENKKTLIKNNYLLSLCDLNRLKYLEELIDAGITSFKIEGRLKDKSYVTNIVGLYRKKLDEIIAKRHLKKSSSGTTILNFEPNPNKTFNRGYTDYGLHNNKNDFASIYTPKSIGERIGTVIKVYSDYFILSSEETLNNADGICFLDRNENLRGSIINKVDGNKIYPDKINFLEQDTIIYRNYDRMFNKELEKQGQRTISVNMSLSEVENGFKLKVSDEDGNNAESLIFINKDIAEKKELARQTIEKQLLKLGGTIFACKKLDINIDNIYLIPISILNQLRRNVIENLLSIRNKKYSTASGNIQKNDIPYPIKEIDYLGNVLNNYAEQFYNRHGTTVVEKAAESGLDMTGKRLMITKYCIRLLLKQCKGDHKLNNPLYLLDENGKIYTLQFNCKICKMEILK